MSLGATAELVFVISAVHRGKGSLGLVADAVVMIFLVAVAAMGLGTLEMNERFAALLELIGEDKRLGT